MKPGVWGGLQAGSIVLGLGHPKQIGYLSLILSLRLLIIRELTRVNFEPYLLKSRDKDGQYNTIITKK